MGPQGPQKWSTKKSPQKGAPKKSPLKDAQKSAPKSAPNKVPPKKWHQKVVPKRCTLKVPQKGCPTSSRKLLENLKKPISAPPARPTGRDARKMSSFAESWICAGRLGTLIGHSCALAPGPKNAPKTLVSNGKIARRPWPKRHRKAAENNLCSLGCHVPSHGGGTNRGGQIESENPGFWGVWAAPGGRETP